MYRESDREPAKYIVRFDDICPTMNWDVWKQIVDILDAYRIKPIIAVVPNNQDLHLKYQKADPAFWQKVKRYQDNGYMVAMHGYNHVYTNHNSGLMGISANSEFATVSMAGQKEKIDLAQGIFAEHGIRVDAFVAPSHSFDRNTVKILAGGGGYTSNQ
ncbi:MAG: DUF2334 domain-containing protein [Clostridia bacterium]